MGILSNISLLIKFAFNIKDQYKKEKGSYCFKMLVVKAGSVAPMYLTYTLGEPRVYA